MPSWTDRTYLLPALKSIAFEYNGKNGVNIEIMEPYLQDAKGASQKLSVELMSGKGPDILINPGHCLRALDIHKVMDSGVFADLGPLLALEGKRDQYFTKVLDSGKYGDEQLIVPLFFGTINFVSTRDVLKQNHFEIGQCGTYDGFKRAQRLFEFQRGPSSLDIRAAVSVFVLERFHIFCITSIYGSRKAINWL